MAATLRETNEANRNHIFRLTITDKGFECSEVISARRVRDDGLLWRVRCADSQVYSAEVNEYGRLEIVPTPYGDIPIGSAPIIQSPDGDRSLELPDRR